MLNDAAHHRDPGKPYSSESLPRNSPSESPNFLTVDEAAALLRVGRNALYLAIERGEVRGVRRIGKLIRIRASSLLMDEHERG